MIFPTPYIAAGALAVGLLTGWTANGWRLNGKIDEMVLEHTQAVQVATQKALDETNRMQREKDDAVAKAQAQAKSNAAAADAARAERDGLRDDLAASRTTFADSTHASLAAYADTLSVVFEQCTKEYSDVAAKADGHSADANTLFTAWTAIAAMK
jgi:septal ring factor EnvC (AmiA/AmiB activator)